MEARPGGKGANQSMAVAKAGGNVSFVGAIGEDGTWVGNMLKDGGVDTSGLLTVQERTGRAVIQVDIEGENSIILFKGANHASLSIPDSIGECTHILLQNEIPFDATLAYILLGSAANISTIFNPSPLPTHAELKVFPWGKITWLVLNAGEASQLLSVFDPNCFIDATPDSALMIAQRLSSHIPNTKIICTLGSSGVLALLPQLSEPIHLPAAKLQGSIRNTTGAGDCFTGYLVAGLMELEDAGKQHDKLTAEDIRGVLQTCVQAAGMCVEREGAMESIPTKVEVTERLGAA